LSENQEKIGKKNMIKCENNNSYTPTRVSIMKNNEKIKTSIFQNCAKMQGNAEKTCQKHLTRGFNPKIGDKSVLAW